MNNDQKNFLSKSIQQFQRYVRQSGPAASAAYSLLGSVLLLSVIGYSIDQYYESSPVYLIIGLSLGMSSFGKPNCFIVTNFIKSALFPFYTKHNHELLLLLNINLGLC